MRGFLGAAPLSHEAAITTRNALGPTRHASSCDPSHRPNQVHRPRHPSRDPKHHPSQVHRPYPSQRSNRDPSRRHRDKLVVPSGHASSAAPIARPSNYQSWQ